MRLMRFKVFLVLNMRCPVFEGLRVGTFWFGGFGVWGSGSSRTLDVRTLNPQQLSQQVHAKAFAPTSKPCLEVHG